jgi:anthranilate synthase component 1
MEIIDELETAGRGLYAGAAGYLDYFGNLDTCIAIRTLVFAGGRVHAQAGAGIVADSVPRKEEVETQHKARVLLEALSDVR